MRIERLDYIDTLRGLIYSIWRIPMYSYHAGYEFTSIRSFTSFFNYIFFVLEFVFKVKNISIAGEVQFILKNYDNELFQQF